MKRSPSPVRVGDDEDKMALFKKKTLATGPQLLYTDLVAQLSKLEQLDIENDA